ncbi:MAG: YdeI/OmpD-associated family protein [Verrucomicrobiota bacterium]
MKTAFFRSPAELRKWFKKNHAKTSELWVGFYKKASAKPSVTWQESVDEALCVGWIDGIRKRMDEIRYKIRFTPRRKGSIWSAINIKRATALTDEGRMQPAGAKAFAARIENRSGIYAYEQRRAELDEPFKRILMKSKAACGFFEAQPPSYRKTISWWIVSAKKEETRLKRLVKLIEVSAQGLRL